MKNRLLIGLVLLLTASCAAKPAPSTSYFSLYAPALRMQDSPVPGGSRALSVGPVTLPDILRQARIATGGEGGRYELAEYNRWSGELDRDLARALAEDLSVRLGTEKVFLFPWDQQAAGGVRVLLDVLSMGGALGHEANLSVRWTLVNGRNAEPLLVRRTDASERLASGEYAAWVAAQQRNVGKLGEEIARAVRELAL